MSMEDPCVVRYTCDACSTAKGEMVSKVPCVLLSKSCDYTVDTISAPTTICPYSLDRTACWVPSIDPPNQGDNAKGDYYWHLFTDRIQAGSHLT